MQNKKKEHGVRERERERDTEHAYNLKTWGKGVGVVDNWYTKIDDNVYQIDINVNIQSVF